MAQCSSPCTPIGADFCSREISRDTNDRMLRGGVGVWDPSPPVTPATLDMLMMEPERSLLHVLRGVLHAEEDTVEENV